MRKPRIEPMALVSVLVAQCGGVQLPPPTHGCVAPGNTLDSVRMMANQTVNLPQMCPGAGESWLVGPVAITATPDGLHVQFDVHDASYHPGTFRQLEGDRDAVVVFPAGEAPGRQSLELTTAAAPGGYHVDDLVPWETWRLDGPDGRFRFVCAILDREASGVESEIRIAVQLAVRH